MNRISTGLSLVALCMFLTSVSAHHSAALFDFTRRVELTGVVRDIRVINPHMSLALEVPDGNDFKTINFEGHSVNNFYRAGWRPNMVKVGDRIKVTYAPRKDGVDGGFVNSFTTTDGKEIGFKPNG